MPARLLQFRAIEDRLDDVVNFRPPAGPANCGKRGLPDAKALEAQLDQEFGEGSVALGRSLFTATCASCHSSQALPSDPSQTVDFRSTAPKDPTLRIDFLSGERPVKASEVGTYAARALHSNHMASRVWEQYAARDLRDRPADPKLNEIMKGGGRGYYRPPSLLSLWAYAPFMHNNGIGPEVCGKPSKPELDFYSSPYVGADGKPIANPPPAPYDVSVEGRYKLFKASMNELLNPKTRVSKLFLTDRDIVFDVAPDMKLGDITTGLSIVVPKGFPAVFANSLRYKDLIQDLVLVKRNEAKLDAKYTGIMTDTQLADLKKGLGSILPALTGAPGKITVDITAPQNEFVQRFYSNVLGRSENSGHTEGQDLSERDSRALIAFLATL